MCSSEAMANASVTMHAYMCSRYSSLGGRVAPEESPWMCHDFSARSTMYGIQPAPPSESTARIFGKRSKIPEKIQSAKAIIEFVPNSAMSTDGGASFELVIICDDDPMCMHTGTS